MEKEMNSYLTNKNILILGADGLIGSAFPNNYDGVLIFKTFHKSKEIVLKEFGDLLESQCVFNFDPFDRKFLINILISNEIKIVINCIGITKHKSIDDYLSIKYNSVLPWYLDSIAAKYNLKIVNFSTDCVFTGKVGDYNENSFPDSIEIYGLSKKLGEVDSPNSLTLRTSFFGLETYNKFGLIEWFLRQNGIIHGYSNAIYSGILNTDLALDVLCILKNCSELTGLYHISSKPISKYELLTKLKNLLSLDNIEIIQDTKYICDRSLNCGKIISVAGYQVRNWDDMLNKLASKIKERYFV